MTGGLEVLATALIAMPARAAAVATIVRYKDYGRVTLGVLLTGLSALDLALLVG